MAASVADLLIFHTLERKLYLHLVDTIGAEPQVIKQVIALWLWMQFVGYPEMICHIHSYSDNVLREAVAEAEACLEVLRPNKESPPDENDIPITANLANEVINLRFFWYNRDEVIKGITYFLNKVCNIIFDDGIVRMGVRERSQPTTQTDIVARLVRSIEEGTRREGMVPAHGFAMGTVFPAEMGLGMSSPSYFSLNALGRPWKPSIEEQQLLLLRNVSPSEQEPEDYRSMFLTFSRGYPLYQEDVVDFFTSHWGDCIDKVMLDSDPPLYGKLVFKSSSIIPIILNGREKVKFVVKGKHLWARLFVPK